MASFLKDEKVYGYKMIRPLRKTERQSKYFRKNRSLHASDLQFPQILDLTKLNFGLMKRMKNRFDRLEQQLFLLEDMQIDFQVMQTVSPIEAMDASAGLISSSPL